MKSCFSVREQYLIVELYKDINCYGGKSDVILKANNTIKKRNIKEHYFKKDIKKNFSIKIGFEKTSIFSEFIWSKLFSDSIYSLFL